LHKYLGVCTNRIDDLFLAMDSAKTRFTFSAWAPTKTITLSAECPDKNVAFGCGAPTAKESLDLGCEGEYPDFLPKIYGERVLDDLDKIAQIHIARGFCFVVSNGKVTTWRPMRCEYGFDGMVKGIFQRKIQNDDGTYSNRTSEICDIDGSSFSEALHMGWCRGEKSAIPLVIGGKVVNA